ncbi:hypothetical protein [Pseudoxanthomonas sp. PXM05]|nr:hypothetical protein [Pseudoxanthomonas sp. PXM05]MBV7475349.1 hypothetical protein [Pseudoxanthomonas sp. PXM05]
MSRNFPFDEQPFAPAIDVILVVVSVVLVVEFNDFLWFLLLGLSPRAWR